MRLLALPFVTLLMSSCSHIVDPIEDPWKVKANFPEQPKRIRTSDVSPIVGKVRFEHLLLKRADKLYSAARAESPVEVLKARQDFGYDRGIQRFLKSKRGKILQQKQVRVGPYLGRRYRIKFTHTVGDYILIFSEQHFHMFGLEARKTSKLDEGTFLETLKTID